MGRKSSKPSRGGKVARAVTSILPAPARAVVAGASALGGLIRGRKAPRRRRGFSITRYAQRLLKAKLDAKIQREKFKVLNAIR